LPDIHLLYSSLRRHWNKFPQPENLLHWYFLFWSDIIGIWAP